MEKEQLQVGDWWAACCVHDLQQIVTPDDLEEARQGLPFTGGWHTRDEAIADLLQPWRYFRSEELAEEIEYCRTAGWMA